MKYLIITVAGTATRFNRDTKRETLKCLYYTGSSNLTLLNQLFKNCGEYDKYIIVGGYLYKYLEEYINEKLEKYKDRIELVYNPHFFDYGSGYSLYKGIKAITEVGEVTFVEGDLFFSKKDFLQVYTSKKNVLSINREPIFAKKAVALYISSDGKPHYLYDINHDMLTISEPFLAVFNSAQIWKFLSSDKLKDAVALLSEEQLHGTNLEIIQSYFNKLNEDEYEIITFYDWYNCNTVADYNTVCKLM